VGAVNSVLVLVVASFVGSAVGLTRIALARLREDESPLALGALTAEEAEALVPRPAAVATIPAPPEPEEGAPDEDTLARDLAEGLEMPFVELAGTEPDTEAAEALPGELARRHTVVPLSVTKSALKLAVENPLNTTMIQEIRAATGRNLKFVIAAPSAIRERIEALYPAAAEAEPEAPAEPPLWKQFHDVASLLPVPKPTHHLPFIPWIATGAVAIVAFQGPLTRLLTAIFDPAF
jgi:hypothetical protein